MQVVWLIDFGPSKTESFQYCKRTAASIVPQTTREACGISTTAAFHGLIYPSVDGIISVS